MEGARSYRVQITRAAQRMLRHLRKKYGKSTYETLRDLIHKLEFDPDKKGEPLKGPLKGFYSLHHGRYRIVYTIREKQVEVFVVGAGYHRSGDRNDIYRILQRMIQQATLELKPDDDH